MPRIAIAECKQEVSSFSPARSRFEDFRIVRGIELLAHHRRVREEVGGALNVFDADPRVELVPAFGASAMGYVLEHGGPIGSLGFSVGAMFVTALLTIPFLRRVSSNHKQI